MKTIKFEKEGAVAKITLNRPESLNAINLTLGDELLRTITDIAHDETIRAVIITGQGKKAFCAGGDVNEMLESKGKRPPTLFKKLTHNVHAVVSGITRMKKPVICGVNGVAAGAGFSLAIACDIVIASERARFTFAYPHIGLSPDGGATLFLSRLVGLRKAIELYYENPIINSEEALEIGLINQVVPDDELDERVKSHAEMLASGPTYAFGRTKRLFHGGLVNSLETHLEEERQAIADCSDTEDFQSGVSAFANKTKPEFSGK